MKATYALLAAAIAQEAAATWNLLANPFKSPNYNDNECSDKQKAGFDWSDLQDGASNFQYGDFDFSAGWKCSSAKGKRDSLTKRTFGQKTISNICSKQKPATFGCDKRKSGFSVTTIDISVEFEVEVDLHYKMGDGSLCKQKSVPCKTEGNTIENTQCGGATSVEVYLGSKYQGQKSECQIDLHHIGFDCNPGKEYKPPTPPAPSTPPIVSSKPAVPSAPPVVSSKPAAPSSPPPASASCGEGEGYGAECPPVVSSVATTPVEAKSSSVVYTFPSPAPLGNNSAPIYVPTPSPYSPPSLPSAPTPPSPPATPAVSHSSPPSYPTGGASPPPPPASKSTPSAPPAASSTPSKGEDVPPQLPQCMNTWLQISTEDCKDNTATDCYCTNAKFTKNVIDCVQAWCETDEQSKQALQILVGICAEYVPKNPGLVGDCPSDTFTPMPAAPPADGGSATKPSSGSPAPPVMSAAPPTPVSSITPITIIVYNSTAVTVPMVHFSTVSISAGGPTPSAPVGLVGGSAPTPVTPPSTPGMPTPAPGVPGAPYPVPSTMRRSSVLPSGTGAIRPSEPAQFTGAASVVGMPVQGAFIGAVLAFMAL